MPHQRKFTAVPRLGVQRRVGAALRVRVSGSDSEERGRAIWGTPGPRWFGPDDAIWQVHESASMFVGGLTALLLQALHPAAMAGVGGHSGYKSDPWGRLQRTADYLAITTYGTVDAAEDTIARIRGIHSRVRGRDHLGRPYRASDPHLLRWVQIAETWSFLEAFQVYMTSPLSTAKADEYVAQTASVGARLGATGLPSDVAELNQQISEFRDELEATPQAREVAQFLVHTPPVSGVLRPAYGLISAGGLALLPQWAMQMLGLRWPGGRPTARRLGAIAVRGIDWGLRGDAPDRSEGYRLTLAE